MQMSTKVSLKDGADDVDAGPRGEGRPAEDLLLDCTRPLHRRLLRLRLRLTGWGYNAIVHVDEVLDRDEYLTTRYPSQIDREAAGLRYGCNGRDKKHPRYQGAGDLFWYASDDDRCAGI